MSRYVHTLLELIDLAELLNTTLLHIGAGKGTCPNPKNRTAEDIARAKAVRKRDLERQRREDENKRPKTRN